MDRVARLDYERTFFFIVLAFALLLFLPPKVLAQDGQITVYPNQYYSAELAGAGTTTKQIYAGDVLIATIETVGGKSAVHYVHPDVLSSTNIVTDANGNLVENTDYYPYGQPRIDTKTGYGGEDRKFIGQVYDLESQLSYLNARYYSGARGQFLSEDPTFWSTKQNLEDPQALNSYSYGSDNPVTKSDPTGLLTVVVPGTNWNWNKKQIMCTPGNTPLPFLDAVGKTFHETPTLLTWSGKDDSAARSAAATNLASIVNNHDFAEGEKLNIVGYSHGGNVAIEASNMDMNHKIDNLVTIGTPVRSDYKPNYNTIRNHINAYSIFDAVQGFLGGDIGIPYPEVGPAGRTYADAQNINVMYETSFRPLQSHYNLPSPDVWERVDAYLRADGTN